MISLERFSAFAASLERELPEELFAYGRKAKEEGVPVIREDTAGFLRTLLAMTRPKEMLEVGTGVGFSGLLFCEYAPAGMHLWTIELDPARAQKAREAFARFGRSSQITLLEGDASRILPALEGSYDMIFMDAAKGQYRYWLPEVQKHMHTGSILVSDNCLQEGEILESRFLVERRDRTRHHRMREYLFELTHQSCFETSILPVGDGLAVSVYTEGMSRG